MTERPAVKKIPDSTLLAFATALLQAGGFAPSYAAQTADQLIWANLKGADSHGVLRIPRYNEMVGLGILKGDARPSIHHEFGAVAVYDGDLVPGASGLLTACEKAADLAAKFGIGICSIMRTNHAGAVGYFAEHLARKGFCSIVMTASKPLMVYHGAKGEGVSTNPIAIGVPAPDGPVVLDMSTASVALGKIMAAKDAGQSIPIGWGVDADGVATEDPAKVKAVLPMAGPKGSGLSLMIEMLVSVLGGNPLISPALTNKKDNGFNGSVIAFLPEAFGPSLDFATEVAALQHAIHALPPLKALKKCCFPASGAKGSWPCVAKPAFRSPLGLWKELWKKQDACT